MDVVAEKKDRGSFEYKQELREFKKDQKQQRTQRKSKRSYNDE